MQARLYPVLLALLLSLCLSQAAHAQTSTYGTATSRANVRNGPGTTYAAVGSLAAGAPVAISGCNSDCSWYQIGDNRWVAAFLIETTTAAPQPTTASPVVTCATVGSTGNLRSGPGTNFGVVGSAQPGQCLTLTGRNADSTWLQLNTGNWIAAFLVSNPGQVSALPVIGTTAPIVDPVPPTATPGVVCDSSYPTLCIPPGAPDLDCGDINDSGFPVTGADPHLFDADNDGIGCEIDGASPSAVVPSQPAATPVPLSQPAPDNCDPNYTGACIPKVGYDLDCGDISARRFQSVGSDPHRFDGDNDGLACES